MQYKQVSPIACLAECFQGAFGRLMTATTAPTLVIAPDLYFLLLSGQLLKIVAVIQQVVIVITVCTISFPLFLGAVSWRGCD